MKAVAVKKKRAMLSSMFEQHARPEIIRKAVKFLLTVKYPFYSDVHFDMRKLDTLLDKLLDDCEEDIDNMSEPTEVEDAVMLEKTPDKNTKDEELCCEEKEDVEYVKYDPVRKHQTDVSEITLLLPENRETKVGMELKKTKSTLILAPGEDQKPCSILKEKHPFVLHFPCLFPDGKGGLHDENRSLKLNLQEWIIQRLQNINPMFAQFKPFIFTAVNLVEEHQLMSRVNVSYLRGRMTKESGGRQFLQTEDGFNVFDNIRGSPRYWQKMKYDLVAKMEQLGPVQFFYTLSCANKRWEENLATIVAKTYPGVIVLHFIEEIACNESILEGKEKKSKDKEYEEEDECNENEDDVDIIDMSSAKTKMIYEDNPEFIGKPIYYVHERVDSALEERNCRLHTNCRRRSLFGEDGSFIDKATANKLQSDHVLEISRNFNHRIKSFRKNILMCKKSPLKIQYYQDRVEFQARGHPHIHGMAWSRKEELDKIYPGLQLAFNKLKERVRLDPVDTQALAAFADETITCSRSQVFLKKYFDKYKYEKSKDSDLLAQLVAERVT